MWREKVKIPINERTNPTAVTTRWVLGVEVKIVEYFR